MSLVLAIEPDLTQAEGIREVLQDRFGAQLVVVASKHQAIEAIDREVPDLVLVSALLSPRDEDDLVAHLRRIPNGAHLQLLTIPRLAAAEAAPAKKGSRFGFGKKRPAPAQCGCDPAEFAEQVAAYLTRAREVRSRPRPAPDHAGHAVHAVAHATRQPIVSMPFIEPMTASPVVAPSWEVASSLLESRLFEPLESDMPVVEPAAAGHALFDLSVDSPIMASPIELPLAESAILSNAVVEPPSIAREANPLSDIWAIPPSAQSPIAKSSLFADEPAPQSFTYVPPLAIDPTSRVDDSADSEVERLISQLGIGSAIVDSIQPVMDMTPPPAVKRREPNRARAREQAESKFRAELERVQAEAAERHEAELAQWQAEAVALREATVTRARAEAEAEARQARQALAVEIERVQTEAAHRREIELTEWQAEAEAIREATIGRARAAAESEAREALTAELARVRSEAEQARQADIVRLQHQADERLDELTKQARQAAEREAARALSEELARVRTEAESAAARTLEEEVAQVRAAADARLQQELERVRREAEQARRVEQAQAQAEADRIREAAAREARSIAETAASRTLEAEIQRVRAEAEARFAQQTDAQVAAEKVREAAAREARVVSDAAAGRTLEAEIQRVRAEADARFAKQTQAQVEADTMREAAAREARLRAEESAQRTLQMEIERVRTEADQRLASELSQLRVEAERRRAGELEDVRKQVADMRDAAAQQARSAAEEAVAAEIARIAAQRGATTISIVKAGAPKKAAPAVPNAAAPSAEPAPPQTSYYDLFRSSEREAEAPGLSEALRIPTLASHLRRARWMLPMAASLLVVIGVGATVDTSAWRESAKNAIARAMPSREAARPEPQAAPPPPSGDLLVETTPKGARVLVDGKLRGQSPVTVASLTPGRHKLVLESKDGVVIRRDVTIRVGERAVASELLVSGWLSVHSRIPVEIHVSGRRVGASGDGQVMLSPGRHKVTFVNTRLNVRDTQSIDIQAGAIKSHTVKLSPGTLSVNAPAGAEVWVDGERIGEAPLRGVAIALGTREVVVRHPDFGEHRETVEIRQGASATITVGPPNAPSGDRSFDGLKVLSESAANPRKQVPAGRVMPSVK